MGKKRPSDATPVTQLNDVPELQIDRNDRFPDCLRLSLIPHWVGPAELRLDVQLEFADMWVDWETSRYLFLKSQWRFRFSLSAGELCLDLRSLSSPPEKRNFRLDLPVSRQVTRSVFAESTSVVQGDKAIEGGWEKGLPKLKVTMSEGNPVTTVTRATDSYSDTQISISSKGSDDAPKWVLRSRVLEGVLEGVINSWLATLQVLSTPFELTARFVTSFDGIRVLEVDSPEYADASPKRQRVLKAMMQRFVRETVDDWISKCELRSQR